jgi:hypothetical protein
MLERGMKNLKIILIIALSVSMLYSLFHSYKYAERICDFNEAAVKRQRKNGYKATGAGFLNVVLLLGII